MPSATAVSSVTCTVATKLPHGLHLQLYDFETRQEPTMGGGFRDVKVAIPVGDRVTLKGYAHAVDKAPTAPIVGGFGLTHGVSTEFMEKWLEQNEKSPIVKGGFVFISDKVDTINKIAAERESLKNKMEPLDPDKMPKGLGKAKV